MLTIDCPRCKITIEHEANKVGIIEDDSSIEASEGDLFTFLKCPQCKRPIVTVRPRIFEFNEFVFGLPSRIYPSSEFHINHLLPKLLQDSLVEAIGCYDAKLFTATAIMCRRAIDGFCKLNGATKWKLEDALKELRAKDVINDEIHKWAEELRLYGNEAAHDIQSAFSQTDAKDILDFTIAILDFCYSYKKKFDEFSKRRKAKTN